MKKAGPLNIAAAFVSSILLSAVFVPCQVSAAGSLVSSDFIIAPAVPVSNDPSLGYSDVDPANPFQLPGGPPLSDDEHGFEYPPTRFGKFVFDLDSIASLFPIHGDHNNLVASDVSLRMSITDLDTNAGDGNNVDDADYEDIIFALSLNNEDDGSGLLRILTDRDGAAIITPQFITGFGNQSISDFPDIATNDYDLSVAPMLGSNLATLISGSGGEIWLYIIDTDDAGNNVSLANSLAADFTLSLTFVNAATVPLPPAVALFGVALLSLVRARRKGLPRSQQQCPGTLPP